ncbi:MAG: type II toxin-antitoxin system VapC family toxin [Gemmatimonadota bacterium]|nr:type II toxin-antitoxin system VapC family toxin [Gemmatimonadota bacterium]
MIFVDTNVFMYHVGAEHPLQDQARGFFRDARLRNLRLVTSVEVLQEILHRYVKLGRRGTASAAFALVDGSVSEVWPVERVDLELARGLADRYPGLEARDLVHLACCIRHKPRDLMTFDRGLAAAWEARR